MVLRPRQTLETRKRQLGKKIPSDKYIVWNSTSRNDPSGKVKHISIYLQFTAFPTSLNLSG